MEYRPKILRPTWAEIDTTKFENNIKLLRLRTPAKFMLVLKADAYGHGACALGKFAEEKALADMFGVASVEEGLELRAHGLKTPILVLGSIYPFESFQVAVANDLAVTVASMEAASEVISASAKLGKKAVCHVKQDTGMGRIGARRTNTLKILEKLSASENVVLEGLYTHLSCAECADISEKQFSYFEDTLSAAKEKNIKIPLTHACATAGLLNRGKCYDMVRIGIGAYGGLIGYGLEGALSLKSKIVYIKDIKENFGVSYGRRFVSDKKMRVATLPVGYADGYLRALSGKAEVLISGKRCPVLGNVTMDMIMVDITAVKAKVGDEAVLIGRQGEEEITTTELSLKAGTISYEITSLLTKRVPRVYK